MLALEDTDHGFVWGPVEVARTAVIDRRVVLRIETAAGQEITVYVSGTGRSLRVFKDGTELTAGGAA
ncbi:hypothetical protein [Nocardia farcinica]|uniref:hypothetical protein n=1 Tax=Nocardia farcinica TaxID=37329 RepID=UPI002455C5F5|nr:hypothetical protein [Nocardia farcinica]